MVAGFAPLLCPPLRIGRICEFKIWNGIWDRKLRKKLRERFSVDLNFLIKNIGIFNVSGWWDIYYTFERSEEVDDEWLLRHWGERSVYVYSHAIKVTAKLSFASVVDRSPVAQCYANTLRDNLESISRRFETLFQAMIGQTGIKSIPEYSTHESCRSNYRSKVDG